MKRRWDVSVRDGTGPRLQEELAEKRGRGHGGKEREGERRRGREKVAAERRATAQWGKLIAEIWVQCKRVARLGLTGGL